MAARSRDTYNPDNTTRTKDQQEMKYGDEYTKKEKKKKTSLKQRFFGIFKPGNEKKKEGRVSYGRETSNDYTKLNEGAQNRFSTDFISQTSATNLSTTSYVESNQLDVNGKQKRYSQSYPNLLKDTVEYHYEVIKDKKDGDDLDMREAAAQTLKTSHALTKFERKTQVLSQEPAKQSTFQSRNHSRIKTDAKVAKENVKHKPFKRGTISRKSSGLERLRSARESNVAKKKRMLAENIRRSSPATRVKRATAYEQKKRILEYSSQKTTDDETISEEKFNWGNDDRLNIEPRRMSPEGASTKPDDKCTSNEVDSKQNITYLGDGSIQNDMLKSNKSDCAASDIPQHDTTRTENIKDEKGHGIFVKETKRLLHVDNCEGNPRGKTLDKLGGASHPQKAKAMQLPSNDETRSADKTEEGKKSGIEYCDERKRLQDAVTTSVSTGSKSTIFPSTEVDYTNKGNDETKTYHLVDNTIHTLPSRSTDKTEKGRKLEWGRWVKYYDERKHSQDGVTTSVSTGSKSTIFPSTDVDYTNKSNDETMTDHLVDNTIHTLTSRSADTPEKGRKSGFEYDHERKHSQDGVTTAVSTGRKSTIFSSTEVDYTNMSNDETKKYHLVDNTIHTLTSRSADKTEMERKSTFEYYDERKHSHDGITTTVSTGSKSMSFPSTEVDITNTSSDETKTYHLDDLSSSRGDSIEEACVGDSSKLTFLLSQYGHDEAEQKNLYLNMADIEQLWSAGQEIRYSKECEKICTLIKNKSDKILDVWPAYDTNQDKTLIFVCMATENVKIAVEYTLYIRIVGHCSKEGKRVMQSRKNAENRLSAEQSDKISNVIDHYANTLMQNHRYISIITGSGVRSVGFATENEKIIPEACVVIYVFIKGKIPLDEKEIPESLDGTPVDIREGDFQTCVLNASDYHDTDLRMGCQIMSSANQYGTLGGFVEHQEYGLCGITCAHVILNEENMHAIREKEIVSNQGHVYQPDNTLPSHIVGPVKEVTYKSGVDGVPGIDLAVFQIENRPPECGNFPGISNSETDLVYESGRVGGEKQFNTYNQQVLKFGSRSGVTEGVVEFCGTCVRKISYDREYTVGLNRYTYTLFSQLEIRPSCLYWNGYRCIQQWKRGSYTNFGYKKTTWGFRIKKFYLE